MRVISCTFLALTLAVPPSARPVALAQQAPTFRAGVTLVQLDVSVLDKDTHKPVRGLTAADFSIFEDDHPQSVAAFSAVDVPDPPTLPIVDGQPVTWTRDVPPDVQSNAIVEQRESRLWVMLIDDAMIPGDPWMIRQAKKAANSVIDKLGPADRMALVMTMQSKAAQDFTSDRSKLHAAVEKMSTGYAGYYFGWDNATSSNRPVSGVAKSTGSPQLRPEPGNDSDVQLRDATYNTLVGIADALLVSPERRKALVYISPGVAMNPFAPNGPTNTSDGRARSMVDHEANERQMADLPGIFRRMQQANINIYSIDPGGLDGIAGYVAGRLGSLPAGQKPLGNLINLGWDVQDQMTGFLMSVANSTGGFAVVKTNDVEPGIQRIFQENGSFYLLGYQPPANDKPGTLHRLQVKVNRPNVEVRTRSGYYTPAIDKPDPRRAVLTPIQKAIANVLPSANLALRVALAPFAAKSGANVTMTLGIDAPPLPGGGADTVEIMTSAFTQDGVDRGTRTLTARVVLRSDATTATSQYEVLTNLGLPPGRYRLRIAASSKLLGATGSVFADVDVPDFVKDALSLSGVALGVEPPLPSSARESLNAIVPISPTAQRSFRSTDRVTAFLRVYQGRLTSLAPVQLSRRIVNERGESVVNERADIGIAAFDATLREASQQFLVPIEQLSPGQYLLTIEAASKSVTARRDVRFIVR